MSRRRQKREQRLQAIINRALADTQESAGASVGDAGRLIRVYFKPHAGRAALVAVSLVIWAAVPYFFAFTQRYMIDDVLGIGASLARGSRDMLIPGLWFVFWANMGLHSINLLCHSITSYLTLHIGMGIAIRFREEIYTKLNALELSFFDRTQTGRIIARIQSDVANVQNAIQSHLGPVLIEPVKLVAGTAVLLWLNWRLALIVVCVSPVYAGVFLFLRPRIRRVGIAQSRLHSRIYGLATERLSSILLVKVFGQERRELGRFSRLVHDGVRVTKRQTAYNQSLSLLAGVISGGATAVILWVGLTAVRRGDPDVSLGKVIIFVQLTQQVFAPIQVLTSLGGVIQTTFVSLRRVFALLDENTRMIPGRIRLTGMKGKLDFADVTFHYPSLPTPALVNVSLTVKPGEKVAVMGPSGGGKSSLFYLLLRFHDPQQGIIRVGGVDVPDADLASLRRHVRLVQQEPFVFSGTIAQNMTYGAPEATEKQMVTAAKQAELHDFVMGLPERYDTMIGENGMGLSGGQKQRLALATALLTNPEVLLLDDVTSALDAGTEAKIRATLLECLKGRTSLIVTQRISTAMECDRVIVLENGRITQVGTHEQLAGEEGFYQRILTQQNLDKPPSARPGGRPSAD
ncbi:MAG: ABC transporter ATP-binding protein [Lentisphaeria bacterium]|nr:ABC transporter ATP-binding protein [Lentisphaeria bacterium]